MAGITSDISTQADKEVAVWFCNVDRVMKNLNAFSMAREALAVGKSYCYKFVGLTGTTKFYGAPGLMSLYQGVMPDGDNADVEYLWLVNNQNNVMRVYFGLRKSFMDLGKTNHNTYYTTLVSGNTRQCYNNLQLIGLYNTANSSCTTSAVTTTAQELVDAALDA